MDATASSDGSSRQPTPMIRLQGVGKTYDDGTVAVHELDLDVRRGEMVCLVGPSGCGKSTTLKMINRLIEPTTGRIILDGTDVTEADPVQLRRGIGYVIQQIGLFPHQKIINNVMTVPLLYGESKSTARERARELMDDGRPRPRPVRRPLPAPALRRPAPARRRGPRARGQPAGAADGRALRRRRPGRAHRAPGRVPATAARPRQDRRARHPRHRRGRPDGRSGRGLRRRAAGSRSSPRRWSCSRARPTTSWPTSSGSTRGLRRLTVTPLREEHLEPLDGVNGGQLGAAIDLDSSLEEALAALLRDDKPMIGVKRGAQFVGVLTPNGVHQALRESLR